MKKYTLVGFSLLIIGIALLLLAYTYYTYSQANALRACAEYGAGLDRELAQRLKPPAVFVLGTTKYQFKNGICYRDFSYSFSDTGQINSGIEDAYTHKPFGGCTFQTEKGIFTSDRYFKNADGSTTENPACTLYFKYAHDLFGEPN